MAWEPILGPGSPGPEQWCLKLASAPDPKIFHRAQGGRNSNLIALSNSASVPGLKSSGNYLLPLMSVPHQTVNSQGQRYNCTNSHHLFRAHTGAHYSQYLESATSRRPHYSSEAVLHSEGKDIDARKFSDWLQMEIKLKFIEICP